MASKTSMKSLRTGLVRFYTFFVMKTWGRVCVCVAGVKKQGKGSTS